MTNTGQGNSVHSQFKCQDKNSPSHRNSYSSLVCSRIHSFFDIQFYFLEGSGPQLACPQVQGLAGSVAQGVTGVTGRGKGWESRRAGITERTRAHSFSRRCWGGGKWNMDYIFLCWGAERVACTRCGVEYVSIILCQTQKIPPGQGYVLFVPVLSLNRVSHLCFARVGLRIDTGFFCVSGISRIIPAQRNVFVITQHVYLE